jgi:hypothetical protein
MPAIFTDPKFWLAVVALAQTILFQFVPDFPPAVWQAIDAVLVILIGSLAAERVAKIRYLGDE